MELDALVWIPDTDDVWIPGVIASVEGSGPDSTVQVRRDQGGQLVPLGAQEIRLRNEVDADGSTDAAANDLIRLPHLHEASILNALVERARESNVYTNTGPILLAINPYKKLKIYTEEVVQEYFKNGLKMSAEAPPPHLYAVTDDAYRAMMRGMEAKVLREASSVTVDQSMLVSGESGAGKTVSTRFIMQYLAIVGRSQQSEGASSDQDIQNRVLESNPVLESFGNARTIRNDNSSRFGKYIEIGFNTQGLLTGAMIRTYLLENVRVVFQAFGERNYHIFYELWVGASAEERELLHMNSRSTHLESLVFLNNGECTERRDGVSDSDMYTTTRKSMSVIGFSKSEQLSVLVVVAALSRFGNVDFIESESTTHQVDASRVDPGSDSELLIISKLLELTAGDIARVLCNRQITTQEETYSVSISPERARDARDALSKAVYRRLFDWIVRRVNNSLDTGLSFAGTISILDIFGFEIFEVNSFEQLMINYTNEHIQNNFNQYIFEKEQEEYRSEGLDWTSIPFPDNSDVLDLIESRRNGLLKFLDDECVFPSGNDAAFVNKLYRGLKDNKIFVATATHEARGLFELRHYAGQVCYSSQGFCDKNRDALFPEAIELLKTSSSNFISSLFSAAKATVTSKSAKSAAATRSLSHGSPLRGASRTRSRRGSLVTESVSTQFKSQLGELLSKVAATAPHFVRCLKPNDENKAGVFDKPRIVEQLRYSGVLEAVRVARAGFPVRYMHREFLSRYGLSVDHNTCAAAKDPATAIAALSAHVLNLREGDVRVGKTKVFLKKGAFEALERSRAAKLFQHARRIQSVVRMMVARILYIELLRRVRAANRILSQFRGFRRRAAYRVCRLGVVSFQLIWRKRARARAAALQAKINALVNIQRWLRGAAVRRKFLSAKRQVIAVQCRWRLRQARKLFKVRRREFREVSNLVGEQRRLKGLVEQMQSDLQAKAHISDEMLATVQSKVTQLGEEKDALAGTVEATRNENARLRASALEMNKEAAHLRSELSNFAKEKEDTTDRLLASQRELKHAMLENDRLKATNLEGQRDRALLVKSVDSVKLQKHELWAAHSQLQQKHTQSSAAHLGISNKFKLAETQLFSARLELDELNIRYSSSRQRVEQLQATCERMERVHGELRNQHEQASMQASTNSNLVEKHASVLRVLETTVEHRDAMVKKLTKNLLSSNNDFTRVSTENARMAVENETLRAKLIERANREQELRCEAEEIAKAAELLRGEKLQLMEDAKMMRQQHRDLEEGQQTSQAVEDKMKSLHLEVSKISESLEAELVSSEESRKQMELLEDRNRDLMKQVDDSNAFIREMRQQIVDMRKQRNGMLRPAPRTDPRGPASSGMSPDT